MSEEQPAADLPLEEEPEAEVEAEQEEVEGEGEGEGHVEGEGETAEAVEGDEAAAVEEALGDLDSVHEEAAQDDDLGEEEVNAEAEVAEASQRSSPVSERSQGRLSLAGSQRSKPASQRSHPAEGGSQRSGRSQKGTPVGSTHGRLSKATMGSKRSIHTDARGAPTSYKDEDIQAVFSKAFPTQKDVVLNNVVQLEDIESLLTLLEETEMDELLLQDLKNQAEALREENTTSLNKMIDLRTQIEESAMTSGVPVSDDNFLQLKLLKMQGKGGKGSTSPAGSKSGKGSRQGGRDGKTEDSRSNAEKQKQDELIKQLAQRNNDLSQKVHELERFVETSLKEAKLKMNESSKHDRLVSQLFKENAQLAVSLETSEQTRRVYERELTSVREKHAAMLDLLKKTLLVSVDKK